MSIDDHLAKHVETQFDKDLQTLEAQDTLGQIESARRAGTISEEEYKLILQHDYGIVEEQRSAWPMMLAIIAIVGIFGLFAFWGGSITGFVVFPTEDVLQGSTFSENSVYTLNIENTTTLKISGEYSNTASVYAQSQNLQENNTYLVGLFERPDFWTTYSEYSVNETIDVALPQGATLWLENEAGENTPLSQVQIEDLRIEEAGTYTLIAITNDTRDEILLEIISNENNNNETQEVENVGGVIRKERFQTFENICVDTCSLEGIPINNLIITVEGTLNINEIIITENKNNTAPQIIAQIPTVAVNESVTIDLAPYFSDAEGDELSYEINNIVGVQERIEGSELTLIGNQAGTYTATLYVSDLKSVTTTTFTIIVLSQETNDNTNSQTNTSTNNTQNTNNTINESNTNEISNQTTNTTNNIQNNNTSNNNPTNSLSSGIEVLNISDACANEDINLRPPECFGDQFAEAFEDIVAPLKDKQQQKVARFTRLGNLVIAGEIIEESTSEPQSTNFALGYTTRDGFRDSFTPTVWIDDAGNLHLKGHAYEEQISVRAPQYESYVIANSNGIVLAYFNERTGDLYLKGNLVQLGRP